MKRKGWFIPILIFFISITGLIFYQKRQDSHSFAGTTNLPPILWSESSTNINKIVFSENGHEIQALRKNNEWELIKPLSSKADNLFIYNIIVAFKEPAFTQTIDPDPKNLADYGIDSFSPHIELYTINNHTYELTRGKLADAQHYYIYSPMSNTVYTMSKSAFENLHTDLLGWRNKDLLSFKKKDVKKIELSYNNNFYTLLPFKSSSDVVFKTEGLEEKKLNKLIDFLEASTVKEFITDTADSALLNAYGFNTPSLKLTITLNSGEALTASIGNMLKAENLCYAVINHSSSISTIPYFDLSGLAEADKTEASSDKTLEKK